MSTATTLEQKPNLGYRPHHDPRQEARENLPQEEYLVVLFRRALTACEAALVTHEEADGDHCACELFNALYALEFHLETAGAAIDSNLRCIDRENDLTAAIDRQTRREPVTNSADLDQLLRLLALIGPAAGAVLAIHDEAVPSGHCGCDVCRHVWVARYTTRLFLDILDGQLTMLPEERAALRDGTDTPTLAVAKDLAPVSAQAPLPSARPIAPRTRRHYWEPSDA